MSYKVRISGGITLKECIEHIAFGIDDSRNSIIITGKTDTDEKTAGIYQWALLSGTNPECYKEITVEQYQKELLVRKVKFSKAFVIDYSESYSNYAGAGTFTLYLRQFYNKEIEVITEETNKPVNAEISNVIEKIEEVVETVQNVATIATPVLALTKKNVNITDKLAKMKEKQGDVESVFVGKLYGKDVVLDDVEMRKINYIKRSDEAREKLRKEFDSTEREKFIKKLADECEEELREAGITDTELLKMKDGLLPSKDWQVHHKLPLDDGGTNSEDNLVLIKNHPYHKIITTHQNTIIAKQIEGKDECVVAFPVPPGTIYPAETREEFEKSIPKAEPRKKKEKK